MAYERVVTAKEHWIREEHRFVTEALCPFCRRFTRVDTDEVVKKCEHYSRREHGCGGEVFYFVER